MDLKIIGVVTAIVVLVMVTLIGLFIIESVICPWPDSYYETLRIDNIEPRGSHLCGMFDGYTEYRVIATNTSSNISKEYLIRQGWELDFIGRFDVGEVYNATITDEWEDEPVIWALSSEVT